MKVVLIVLFCKSESYLNVNQQFTMDIVTTYNIFLVKTLKEKRYYWARNVFFVLFPLLFIVLTIFTGATDEAQNQNDFGRSYPPISEVFIHAHYKYLLLNINK